MMTIEHQNEREYVLAIDPALSTTGYAVINCDTEELVYINKFITSSKTPTDERINEILTKLFCIASQYNIRDIVLEDGYIGVNKKVGLQLATLRGAIIGTFMFHQYNVSHMLPTEIRMYFGVGGDASKEEVAKAVTDAYPNNKKLEIIGPYSDKQNKKKTSDIYDAISIGVAHIRKRKGGN